MGIRLELVGGMTRRSLVLYPIVVILLTITSTASADWQPVASGVDYRHYREDALDIHVVRVNLLDESIRIVGTRRADRGQRVSEFARRNNALVAINGDFFDEHMTPSGLAIGPCGPWTDTRDTSRMAVAAFGPKRAAIFRERERMAVPEPWITAAVSGWPLLVNECEARTSKQLPGKDSFTRAPHPRTALGLSAGGTLLYLVVADGRREDVPGVTLAELAKFMRRRLRVCRAVNLDGGGSSAMWVDGRIANRPSGGKERRVSDHLAVVRADEVIGCETEEVKVERKPPLKPASETVPPAPRH